MDYIDRPTSELDVTMETYYKKAASTDKAAVSENYLTPFGRISELICVKYYFPCSITVKILISNSLILKLFYSGGE